ncbi:hypothetical protein M2397_003599 [Pseudomonas sp. BIGb0381]|uniref:hypothetical protein n=1 Tax=unclassified Pseudomonas TaxID=196821 RepID=UPI00142F7870|nr:MULTISPECIES: hypothetical protein [unclassified Pseudomonas]MCS4313291.1 hypothetical protein [Pseudomonas sp. BIGb0381]NJJ60880.1 hypothetical protein [Pseudomonas sp. B14(2022)]
MTGQAEHLTTLHADHGRYPQAVSVEDFRRNLAAVQQRIIDACHRVGRDPATVRLRELRDRLLAQVPEGLSLQELSMGMSGDFEIAIEEGATVVRVGQAIFGARAMPDAYYWPTADARPRNDDELPALAP